MRLLALLGIQAAMTFIEVKRKRPISYGEYAGAMAGLFISAWIGRSIGLI